MPTFLKWLTEARKVGAAVAGLIALALASNLVPAEYVGYANTAIGVLTAVGVYKARNTEPTPDLSEYDFVPVLDED